jgi:alpha-1,3/alpha-1,6-mannosyltransferase
VLQVWLSGELAALHPSAFIVDQLSAGIPLLRWLFPATHILFYCHFPDLLLVRGRAQWWRRIWRVPFDALEGWSMRGADRVVVNSEFTKGVVEAVWPGLGGARGLGIVYPCVDTTGVTAANGRKGTVVDEVQGPLWPGTKIVLSVNRFERKKDIGLVIRAFAALDPAIRSTAKLVIAGPFPCPPIPPALSHAAARLTPLTGGYDPRVPENVAYHAELHALCSTHHIPAATASNLVSALSLPASTQAIFLLSVPARVKALLLGSAQLLVYTPAHEHFGIVPLEAMLARVPVLAADTGGPLETVVDGGTGWLRPATDVAAWTAVMAHALAPTAAPERAAMGDAGRRRVLDCFSERRLALRLEEELLAMRGLPRARQPVRLGSVLAGLLGAGLALAVAVGVLLWR